MLYLFTAITATTWHGLSSILFDYVSFRLMADEMDSE